MPNSKPTYSVHLPTGKVITAKGGDDLDKIISLNVVRVYQDRQIRITVEYPKTERSDAAAIISDNRNKIKDFQDKLTSGKSCSSCGTIGHTCDCADFTGT